MPSVNDYSVKFGDDPLEYAAYLKDLKTHTGARLVAGMDEVGRGSLFGDVVVACVALPDNHGIVGIRDSKKISAKKRILLEQQIADVAFFGIGVATHLEVDQHNIFKATHIAARRAYIECATKCDIELLLCDGGLDIREHINIPSRSIIKGDAWSESIGAASIMAKVYRDSQMDFYHDTWPEYNFKAHKGYGTKYHREAIQKHGITPMHRKTFGICAKMAKEGV